MSKFTQGEWSVDDNLLANEKGRLIAIINEPRDEQNDEFHANSRLLREAKNMYEALKEAEEMLRSYSDKLDEEAFHIREILARIDGEQEAQS